MSPPPDPRQCPLCGRPNECGMAAGKGSCWCFSTPVRLARLNEILRGH